MVSGSLTRLIFLGSIIRLFLFILTAIVSFFLSAPFGFLLITYLGYLEPCGGFFDICGLETEILGIILSFVFWSAIVFGALGKKIDYVLLAILFICSIFLFSQEQGTTSQMYLGLIATAVVGNAIGYGLKLARQKWLPNLHKAI